MFVSRPPRPPLTCQEKPYHGYSCVAAEALAEGRRKEQEGERKRQHAPPPEPEDRDDARNRDRDQRIRNLELGSALMPTGEVVDVAQKGMIAEFATNNLVTFDPDASAP